MAKKIAETPLMKQYMEMKRKHPDAVLLFRVGDFYETFSEDAITASEILGITLTRRANGAASHVELAGFPHHALDTYLPRLVRAGKRVAICEQLEDPRQTKTLVKRGITELVTPGVNTNDSSIEASEKNYLAGVHFMQGRKGRMTVGLAYLDITTGEFNCTEGDAASVDKLIAAVTPREMLRMRGTRQTFDGTLHVSCPTYELDDWVYTEDAAERRLLKHFGTGSLKGFGLEDMPAAVVAAGSLLHYMDMTSHTNLRHITVLRRVDQGGHMRLDMFTRRNLELDTPLGKGGMPLIAVINHTLTPAGSRMLGDWLRFPLTDIEAVMERQHGVEVFVNDLALSEKVGTELRGVGDLERLSVRVCGQRGEPRDMLALRDSLDRVTRIRALLAASGHRRMQELAAGMEDCTPLIGLITATIHPEATKLGTGRSIAPGVDAELDSLWKLRNDTHGALQAIVAREIERTGITSLKIGSNNVFGYYIEVRNTHRDKVPADWVRRQTLTQAERYITPELKQLEERLNTATCDIERMEDAIFRRLQEGICGRIGSLQALAHDVSVIDCCRGLGDVATEYNYTAPVLDDSLSLSIVDGRHPVIERQLPPGEPYVPNTVSLDCDGTQIMMITGPNMSGKSALLRQTALIVLLAHIGSFVPARSARIGVVDKIFTRVGASDNISSGESTFMVEMNEAAAILNSMGERSLILFDELGRGTSTYDGISIAWAIVEHIHQNGRCRPKTMFATHYHELNEMEARFERVRNFNVSVREIDGRVVFMRTLQPGGSEHSFGLHVARLAGMPPSILERGAEILKRLERAAACVEGEGTAPGGTREALAGTSAPGEYQMSFFQLDDPLLGQIRDELLDIDVDRLTPIQALQKLHDLQGLLSGR